MARPQIQPPFPRGALIGAGALIFLTLAGVATARLTGVGAGAAVAAPAVETISLVFRDLDGGGVGIFEPGRIEPLQVLSGGTNGFLRATMRGLARERKRQSIAFDAPFQLSRRSDGSLTLDDPSTGRWVDLAAFGSTNAGSFATLLKSRSQ